MSVTVQQHKNFIAGEWVESDGGTMEVFNPATGEVIAEVQRSTEADVDRAVEAASKALPEWLEKTPKDRMELLLKLADVIDDNAEELGKLESLNVGKPMSIARDEMPFSADNLRFFAGAARTLEGKAAAEYVEGYTSIIRREPLGIVAGITPWNYPLMMAVWKMGPALAAGNVQILKPAEQTPLRTLRLRACQAPRGPARLPHRRRRDGEAHRRERGADAEAGPPGARRQGADGRARRRGSGHRRRGGQDRRLLELRPGLHRVLADPRQREDLRRRPLGVGEGRRGDEGRRSRRRRRRRHGAAHLARAAGARARLPRARLGREGDDRHGRRVAGRPRFLREADDRDRREPDSEIVQDEVFGPVVTVQPFASDDEAIEMANGVRYGLAASVFSENVGRALKVAGRLDFGTVWVNEHLFPLTSEMPHGGFKESGYGKDMSVYSMEEYTRVKHVAVKLAE